MDAEVVAEDVTAETVADSELDAALSTPVYDTADELEVKSEEAVTETPQEDLSALEREPETTENKAEQPVNQSAPPPTPQGSGFVPMLLGGVAAGLIGYAFAYFQFAGTQTEIFATPADIADIRSEIAAMPGPVDLAPVETGISALQEAVAEQTARIDSEIAALETRVAGVERQPNADGTLADTAVAAFEAELQGLRDQLEAMSADATAQLSRVEEQAVDLAETAQKEAAKASLFKVQGALESGAPFTASLAELETALGTVAPAALANVSEGTPTLSRLQAEFPAVARTALATARSEGVDGETSGGFTSFLRNQLDVRSVLPQEGDSVDAILSRAESALRAGRLNDTLAEVAALPDIVRASMSDWLAQAEARAAAIDAAETLSSTLTDN